MYKMMWCEVLLVALICLKPSLGLECPSESTPAFKFTVSSRRNTTGYWTSRVQLQHDGEDNNDSGRWDVEVDHRRKKCGHSESIVVDLTITAPPMEENRIPRKCPPGPGYELVSELGYYKYHNDPKNWQQAVDVCAQEGTHLIIVNSEGEAKAVDSMIEKRGNGNLYHWVGIHDLYTEGKFITIFNETAQTTGYCKWIPTEPNGKTRENCGTYYLKQGLNDVACSSTYPFICEGSLYEKKLQPEI